MIERTRVILVAGIVLVACVICAGAAAAPVTVFSDNFNDNSLNAAKWTLDVVGTNNAFNERNYRAEFQTYGPGGGGWHAYLNSKPVTIDGWETIEITGRWTNTGTTSRSHIATVTDADNSANRISVEYDAWESKMCYYWNGGSSSAYTSRPPASLVPFRLVITRNGFEYYENGVLKKSARTSTLSDSRRFVLQIGAWEYSRIVSKTYIDEIVVMYTPDTVAPVTSVLFSATPGPAGWYTGPVTVVLLASDPLPGSGIARTEYSWDKTAWMEFTVPVTVSDEGITTLYYRSTDGAGNTETAQSTAIRIDAGPPLITVASPEERAFIQSETVTVAYSATDSGSGIASVSALLDGTAVADGDVVDLTGLAIGPHTLVVTATDHAGNTASESREFTVEPVPAVVTIEPGTLNLKSQAGENSVTVYIEITGADVSTVDPAGVTLTCNGQTITAQAAPSATGDADNDGIPDLMVKFDRQALAGIVSTGDAVVLDISGKAAGDTFSGSGTIRVIATGNGTPKGK